MAWHVVYFNKKKLYIICIYIFFRVININRMIMFKYSREREKEKMRILFTKWIWLIYFHFMRFAKLLGFSINKHFRSHNHIRMIRYRSEPLKFYFYFFLTKIGSSKLSWFDFNACFWELKTLKFSCIQNSI